MWVLSKAATELCVCEIMDALRVSHYNVSRHLKILKNYGLVQERKEGRWIFYSYVKPENRSHSMILKSISALPESQFKEDNKRLRARMALRKNGKCVVGMKNNT